MIFNQQSIFVITILVVLFCPGFVWAAEDGRLPSEIRDFYLAHNFLKSFSTPEERGKILQRLRLSGKKADFSDLDHRLQQIKDAIQRVNDKLWEIESGIAVAFLDKASFRNPEILGIGSFRVSENSAMVRINKYNLTPKINLAMISLYQNRSDDGRATPNDLKRDFINDQVPKVELHFWFKVNGQWVLNETKIGLLKK